MQCAVGREVVITTERQLWKRLQIPQETIAIAAQTCGVKSYLRDRIKLHGAMNVACRSADGKSIMRYEDCFQAIYGEALDGKKKRVKL